METSGTPAAAETALPRSIALPPPSAMTPPPACEAASSIRADGTSRQRASASIARLSQRGLALSSGSRTPAASQTSGSDARLRAAGGPHERDLAGRLEALDLRDRNRAGVDVGFDRRLGDERDAVARDHRAARRLLQAELEPNVEVSKPDADLAQLVLD